MYDDKIIKENAIKKIARFFKYHKIFFIVVVVSIVIIFISIFGDKGWLTRRKFANEKVRIENQIETEKKVQDSLKKVIEDLNNSNKKIEQIAREKFGMTKEGEKIYKIEVDSTK